VRLPRLGALFLVLGACSFRVHPETGDATGGGSDAGIDAAPRYRKHITLTANSPTPLADFPASIVLSDPAIAMHAQPDGSDLAFTSTDGTPLAFEIVHYAGGALEAWVRVPSLMATADLYLTYGGGPQTSPGPVWSPAVFAAAWHFGEAQPPWQDSAAPHSTMAASAMTTPAVATGIAGGALTFDGVDDTTTAGDPSDGSLDFGSTSFSVGCWVNVTASADPYDEVIDKGGDTNIAGYEFSLGTSNWLVEVGDGGTITPYAIFGQEVSLLGSWHHLVAVVDRTAQTLTAYTDGVLAASTSIAGYGSFDTTKDFAIGTATQMYRFEGTVDEVRVYKTALTADWIAAEHANLAQPGTFVTVGPEETY
jgi:hypothetical protein